MESITLSRLTATTFERLVRALAFELMGPAGVVYSSGPDGARDFTFEGEIRGYESKGWSGYVVLQAKFREAASSSESEVNWLGKQINGELKKFKDKKKKLRRPDYYIIASNVSLSGADTTTQKGKERVGGYTKISNTLEAWKTDIGLRDFDIWPAAKIVDLLCAFPGVRQTYAAWVTSGDVLNLILEQLHSKSPNFSKVVSRGLKEAVSRDQHARLRDAGNVVDDPVRVSQVFIDLPIVPEELIETEGGDIFSDSSETAPQRFVAMLVKRAKERLDPASLEINGTDEENRAGISNKVVIMGGPGQGKSTASMFLAQLFRAVLLSNDPKTQTNSNVRYLVPEIIERAKFEGISGEIIPRYPIWISLPRFADAISAAKEGMLPPPSLLAYFADEMSIQCDTKVERSDLRQWLGTYPWIVILDGLDEVPPSGERRAVIQSIASFETEVAESNADVLMIVTTRPQGYSNDLDKRAWEHWHLLELPAERALAYAEALGKTRYPHDPYRRNEIQKAVHAATLKSATSRLMISPLQVTIMYLIVDTGGSVPAARWNLFNEYFEILRKRERAKGSANQKVLEQNWTHLGPIHQRAGLVLQTDSEHVGSALSFLDAPRFKLMLREFLASEGFCDQDLNDRAEQLSRLALQRLVLLCSREEGKIAFDVRSLQEFMAAAALTSGNDTDVENRLLHIAGKSHWRHTFLIAASRCFADDKLHYLRSRVVALPRTLDADISMLIAQVGSLLSLEMFVDGIGADHPNSRKMLALHALDLLSLGAEEYDDRLSLLVDEHTELLITQMVEKEVSSSNATKRYFAAWKLLFSLALKSPQKFLPLIDKNFPSDSERFNKILSGINHPFPSQKLVNMCAEMILAGSPSEFMSNSTSLFEVLSKRKLGREFPSHEVFYNLNLRHRDDSATLRIGVLEPESKSVSDLMVTRVNGLPLQLTKIERRDGAWAAVRAAANFSASPSAQLLADFLKCVRITNSLAQMKKLSGYLPWPLTTTLISCKDENSLEVLESRAMSGDLGDFGIWTAAEQRWSLTGITRDDLLVFGKGVTLSKEIAVTGMPSFVRYSVSHRDEAAVALILELLQILPQFTCMSSLTKTLEFLQFAALGAGDKVSSIDLEASRWLIKKIDELNIKLSLQMIAILSDEIWSDCECLTLISKLSYRLTFHDRELNFELRNVIIAYNQNTQLRGLLYLIVCALALSGEGVDTASELHESAFSYQAGDDERILFSVSLLLEFSHSNYDVKEEVQNLSKVEDPYTRRILMISAQRENFWREYRTAMLTALVSSYTETSEACAAKLRALLRKDLNAKRSTFIQGETWLRELRLPEDAFTVLRLKDLN